MAQIVKFVDVSKGFAIIDPNAFSENLSYTTGEDAPETGAPILAFAGYNFLPTAYGYRSFFGADTSLDIDLLPRSCSKMFLYQFANFQNILVALCEDGIYLTRPNSSGASWEGQHHFGWGYHDWLGGKGFIMPAEAESLEGTQDLREWTYTVMSNVLYIYRAGDPTVAMIGPLDITGEIVTINYLTPTFLNMTGQMGIFRANGRLGFWDSANSVSWSSLFDPMDHTPALETLAGNATFKDVNGRIITILPQGEGFIIYCTRGVVGVRFTTNGPVPWEANSVSDIAGIAYPFQVTTGATDAEHFAYTSAGIFRVGKYSAVTQTHQFEAVIPDVYDILKESREPVYLDFINGRFLFISLLSTKYVIGGVDFDTETVGDLEIRILMNDGGWDGIDLLPINVDSRYYETFVYVPGDIIPPDYTTTPPSTDEVYHTPIQTHFINQLTGTANVDSTGFTGLNGERITMGVYTKWRGTGKAMFNGRNKANIYPYTLDSNSNHLRNTPIDTSKTFTSSITDIKDLTLSHLGAFVADNADSTMEGGWMYPGPNLVDSTVLGNIDIHMKEMAIVQMQEWDNFEVIMQANYDALNALSNAGGTVEIGTYPSLINANLAMESLILSKMATDPTSFRVGNIVTYTEFEKDVLGVGTADTDPTHSGIGTSQAAYKLRRTWTGGKKIKKRRTASYVVASRVIPVSGFQWKLAGMSGFDNNGVYTPEEQLGASFIIIGSGATLVDAEQDALATFYDTCPSSYRQTNLVAGERTEGRSKAADVRNGTVYYDSYITTISTGIVVHQPNWAGYSTGNIGQYTGTPPVVEYYITETSTYSLQQITLPNYSEYSEMSLTQKVLDWGLATLDPSVPDEYYDPDGIGPIPKYSFGPGVMKKFSLTAGAYTIPGASVAGTSYPSSMEALYPGSSFLIQDGQSAPAYPTFVGAFVLDTALKKWGKMYNSYKVLLDIAPVNALTPYIPATNFGIDVGILDENGRILRMDNRPFNSRITYGKIGFYRAGVIQAQEVNLHFRESFTGAIVVDSSLDGRLADADAQFQEFFFGKMAVTVYPPNVGVWQTVTVFGNYDLQYLEFRGTIAGRR